MKKIVVFTFIVLVSGYCPTAKADGLLFYGCMNNNNGRVTSIKTDIPKCHNNQTLVWWNEVGPQGPKGDTGDVGATGSQGIQGEPGQQGIAGVNGQDGAPGSKGDKGDTGDVGPKGQNGNTLHLVDGNGQDLGILTDPTELRVFIPQIAAYLRFQQEDKTDIGVFAAPRFRPGAINYEQPNCGGTPFTEFVGGIETQYQDIYAVVVAGVVTSPFFVPITTALPKNRTSVSLQVGGPCQNRASPELVQHTLQLAPVTLPFSLPVAWPLLAENR